MIAVLYVCKLSPQHHHCSLTAHLLQIPQARAMAALLHAGLQCRSLGLTLPSPLGSGQHLPCSLHRLLHASPPSHFPSSHLVWAGAGALEPLATQHPPARVAALFSSTRRTRSPLPTGWRAILPSHIPSFSSFLTLFYWFLCSKLYHPMYFSLALTPVLMAILP